jgi:hypothetical protein
MHQFHKFIYFELTVHVLDCLSVHHQECYSKINKFEKLVHLVGFTIEI